MRTNAQQAGRAGNSKFECALAHLFSVQAQQLRQSLHGDAAVVLTDYQDIVLNHTQSAAQSIHKHETVFSMMMLSDIVASSSQA